MPRRHPASPAVDPPIAPDDAAATGRADDADDRDDAPSKSARKRASHALQALGERIVALTPEQTDALMLPERLVDAIVEARRIRAHEGRRRQLQYIGRLMRDVDGAAVGARLDAMQQPHRAQVALQHAAEHWRDRLLREPDALTAFLAEHPAQDAQRLRQLLRAARRDEATPRPRRELYRALLEALQAGAAGTGPADADAQEAGAADVDAADPDAPYRDAAPGPDLDASGAAPLAASARGGRRRSAPRKR